MPKPDPAPPDLELEALRPDPLTEMEIEEALEDTPEGNKRFKRMLLVNNAKQGRFCQRATSCFHGRITLVERKVFAWKYQLAGIICACAVLIPVLGYLLVKVLKL
jgi:hypothetical protein